MYKLVLQKRLASTAMYLVEREIPVTNSIFKGKLREIVTSTTAGRELLSNPFCVGWDYRSSWLRLIADSFCIIDEIQKHLANIKDTNLTYVPMMTGGRDCGTAEAIHEIMPSLTSSHQMEVYSKRSKLGRDKDWTTRGWGIKGALSPGYPRTIVTADINATGATMKRFLATIALCSINPALYDEIADRLSVRGDTDSVEVLTQTIIERNSEPNFPDLFNHAIEQCQEADVKKIKPIDTIIAVNIGSDIAGNLAAEYMPLFVALNPEFQNFYMIYAETVAEVAWENTNVPVKAPGTSLLWRGCPTPEYITHLLQREDPFPWEDCIIYYGSKRSRSAEEHFPELIETLIALTKTYELSGGAYGKREHVRRIMPSFLSDLEINKARFTDEVQRYYEIPHELIEEMYTAFIRFKEKVNWDESLAQYCKSKIKQICQRFPEYNLEVAVYLVAEKYNTQIIEKPDAPAWLWREYRDLLHGTLLKKVRLGEYTPI